MRLGISQEFSALITPQQNGVVERKNKVIQELARAMLHNKDVARNLWEKPLALHVIQFIGCILDWYQEDSIRVMERKKAKCEVF